MLETIINLVLTLILPLITVQIIKKGFGKAVTAVTGELLSASPVLKLILGLGISFLFQVAAQTDLIPGLDPITAQSWGKVLLTLASKAIYDLVHDLRK